MACKQETNVVLINGFIDETDQEEVKPTDLQKNVEIVVNTWELVKQNKMKHGTDFYVRLLTEYPEVRGLFSFASEKQQSISKEDFGLQHQAQLLMTMIDYAVRCLGDLGELVPKLKRLGRRHFVKYHVKEEHFQPVGESLLWTLKEGLGDLFTREVEAAWTSIYNILADVMIEGGREALSESGDQLVEEEDIK